MELYPGATSGGGHISYLYSVAMTRDDLVRNDTASEVDPPDKSRSSYFGIQGFSP